MPSATQATAYAAFLPFSSSGGRVCKNGPSIVASLFRLLCEEAESSAPSTVRPTRRPRAGGAGPEAANVGRGLLGTGPILQGPLDRLLERYRIADASKLCEDGPPRSLLVGQPPKARSGRQGGEQAPFAQQPKPVHGSERAQSAPSATLPGIVGQDAPSREARDPPRRVSNFSRLRWVSGRADGLGAASARAIALPIPASTADCRTGTRSGRRCPQRCRRSAARRGRRSSALLRTGASPWCRTGRALPPSRSCPARR